MEAEISSEKSSHHFLVQFVAWVLCVASGIFFGVLSAFVLNFYSSPISRDPAAWGQFGDFVGGAVNPALSFLSLIALCMTIVLQSRQLATSSAELELSRKELELTREELRRSAKAQEESEKALRKQAEATSESSQMTGINFLLRHYQTEISKLRVEPMTSKDPRQKKLDLLLDKERLLLEKLDHQFVKISGEKNESI